MHSQPMGSKKRILGTVLQPAKFTPPHTHTPMQSATNSEAKLSSESDDDSNDDVRIFVQAIVWIQV